MLQYINFPCYRVTDLGCITCLSSQQINQTNTGQQTYYWGNVPAAVRYLTKGF